MLLLLPTVRRIGNRCFDWLAQPSSGNTLRRVCRSVLFLFPPMRGLFLYRIGQLSLAKKWLSVLKWQDPFFDRILHRIDHMLSVLKDGLGAERPPFERERFDRGRGS